MNLISNTCTDNYITKKINLKTLNITFPRHILNYLTLDSYNFYANRMITNPDLH